MRRGALVVLAPLLLAARVARSADEVAEPAVDLARWEASDAEARWVTIRASGAPEAGWVAFLARRREHDLLEWLFLVSDTGAPVKGPSPLEALVTNDAPGWIRCAVWALSSADSHKAGSARGVLVDSHPGVVLDWLERHPQVAADGPAKSVLVDLRSKAPARGDSSRALPPLAAEEVLAALSASPTGVLDLGDRTRADPGVVYVHQVERALDVLGASSLRGEPWKSRVLALVANENAAVRRKACLAFARFPADEVPLDVLLARLEDEREEPGVRAAAVVGLSYASHPRAYLTLLRLARRADHPAWAATTSRLGDLGDGFVLEHLEGFDPAAPDRDGASARAALEEARKAIAARWSAEEAEPATLGSRVPVLLARAAYADATGDALEGALLSWTLRVLRAHARATEVRAALESVASKEPTSGTDPDAALGERVRELARRALAD